MKRFFFAFSAGVIMLVPTLSVTAQTGPGDEIQQYKSMPPANPFAVPQTGLTPERVAQILQQEGAKTEIKRNQNGSTAVCTTMKKGNWTFVVNLHFTADGKSIDIICPLGNPTKQFSAAQLLEVLRYNARLPVNTYFFYNEGDQRLTLTAPNFAAAALSDAGLVQAVNSICTWAQNSHNVWNPSYWQNQNPGYGATPTAMVQP